MQHTFEDFLSRKPAFYGADYEHGRDQRRLAGQIKRVYDALSTGLWFTLSELEERTGDPQASISAQLRNLRKIRFGSHTIEKEHISDGLYRYRMKIDEIS